MDSTQNQSKDSIAISQTTEILKYGIGFILLAFAISALHIYATEADRLDGWGFGITILAIVFCIPSFNGRKWADWVLIGLLSIWVIKVIVMAIFYGVGYMTSVENTLLTPFLRVLFIALVAKYVLRNPKEGTIIFILLCCAGIIESLWWFGRSAMEHSNQIVSSLKVGEGIPKWKLLLLSISRALSTHIVSLLTQLPLVLAIIHFV